MTDKLEEVARAICHYDTGPSDFNSCCPEPMGHKLCQVKARAAMDPPGTVWGQIAAIYGQLNAADCAMVDREWARMRGYILPSNGSAALAPADGGEG